MEIKKEIRFFFLPDFEEREAYLSAQHRQGWKFVRGKFIFVFEKCQPEEVVYKLDFKPKAQDRSEYVQLFHDYGWEYVGTCNHFICFRKSQEQGELEIYSDRQSKLEMVERIMKKQFFLAVFLFFLLSFLFYYAGMPLALLTMAVIDLPIMIYCLIGLLRLRQRYQEVGQ